MQLLIDDLINRNSTDNSQRHPKPDSKEGKTDLGNAETIDATKNNGESLEKGEEDREGESIIEG